MTPAAVVDLNFAWMKTSPDEPAGSGSLKVKVTLRVAALYVELMVCMLPIMPTTSRFASMMSVSTALVALEVVLEQL